MISKISDGKTKLFAVIGDPVEHTSSPVIQNTFANILKRNMLYCAFHVKQSELETAIKGAFALGIAGLNVTVPHKKAVMEYLCQTDEKAALIGAVNTLKYTDNGYIGYNTDISGIEYTFREFGIDLKDKRFLLLGAGGAACSAAVFAALSGCKAIVIANRTTENAEKLKEHIEKNFNVDVRAVSLSNIDELENCNIVFNATTLGFGDKTSMSPIENKAFFAEKNVEFVFDAIYTPWQTKLLEYANEYGVKYTNGFPMLVYQAVAAQEKWFDEEIPDKIKYNLKEELSNYYRR